MALKSNTLTPKQKSFLRSLAHNLSPVVMTGAAGLSEAVVKEIELALAHHELIKVKLGGADKDLRQQMSTEICTQTGASAVQIIGRILVIYRPAKQPGLKLP
jgi:RNA-binding protein